MLGLMEVLGRVLVGRGVAAPDVAALQAAPQVHPPAAGGQALLAALGGLRRRVVGLGKMLAHCHGSNPRTRPSSSFAQTSLVRAVPVCRCTKAARGTVAQTRPRRGPRPGEREVMADVFAKCRLPEYQPAKDLGIYPYYHAVEERAGDGEVVVGDRLVHACLIDAVRLGGARLRRYRHNDLEHLERLLGACDPDAGRMIVTEGMFSTSGSVCDLPGIAKLARAYGARVVLDSAHDVGLLGTAGRGAAEAYGLEEAVDVQTVTFSKALGTIGGAACGRRPGG
ncbi:hypothetical protein DMB42_15285 [Nonomuraea sp. WAC 01424]|nr:hypothetical protein DMB42_15285 [Nonomuraea sp. WAC 01424]